MAYDASRSYPLVIKLRGVGGNEWGSWQRESGLLAGLAETHGPIVARPLG